MRISDWSSDVCSSDLGGADQEALRRLADDEADSDADDDGERDQGAAGDGGFRSTCHARCPAMSRSGTPAFRCGTGRTAIGGMVHAHLPPCGAADEQSTRAGTELVTGRQIRSEEHPSELQSLM